MKPFAVVYTQAATRHLNDIFDFILERTLSPRTAETYLTRLMAAIDRLGAAPHMGTLRP